MALFFIGAYFILINYKCAITPFDAMTTVSSPEGIDALFANAHEDFSAIIGKPSDYYVQRLRRRNFQALQYIDLRDGTNSTGLILSEVYHKAANENQVSGRANGALGAYNPLIQDDNNNAVRLRQENNWSRNLDRQAAI